MAILGGYGAVNGSAKVAGATGGRTFICYSVPTDFVAGEVTDFSVYLATYSAGTVKLKVFRENGSDFDFVGESQSCTPSGTGKQDFVLDTPLTVQAGDFIGVYLSASTVEVDVDSVASHNLEYITGDITSNTPIASFTELADYALCAQAEGTAGPGITITTPVDYQTFQRNGSDQADISITGTYVGTPTAIEASWNGGEYATIDASPSGNSFSGTLSSQPTGQGTLTVRFTNDASTNDSVTYIGIGDVFVVVGDSLAEGRLNNSQSYSGSYVATMFRESDVWSELSDPTDSDTGSGSIWPLLATKILADQGVPVAFVTCGEGGSDLYGSTVWQPGNSAYLNMASQIIDSGINGVKAFLAHLGPNACVAGTAPTEAGYNTLLDTFANELYSDSNSLFGSGSKLVLMQMGECTTGSPPDRRTAIDNIRAAVNLAWEDNDNVLTGPCQYDISTDDGVHIKSDASAAISAQRWWLAIKEALYSGTSKSGRGPKFSYAYRDETILYVYFDKALDPTSGTEGWRVTDDGTPISVSSAEYYSTYVVKLTLASEPTGTVELLLGSENDGAGADVPTGTDSDSLPAVAFRTTEIGTEPPAGSRNLVFSNMCGVMATANN